MLSPSERSGCDLLMQSAGLLIICHMREETTNAPTKFRRHPTCCGPYHQENPHDTANCKPLFAIGSNDRVAAARSCAMFSRATDVRVEIDPPNGSKIDLIADLADWANSQTTTFF